MIAFTLEGVEKDIESMYIQVYVKKKINDENLHLDDVYGGSQSGFNEYVEREVSNKITHGQNVDDIVKLIVAGTLFYNLYDTYKTLREQEYQKVQRERKKREAKIIRTNKIAERGKGLTLTSRNSTSSSSDRSSTSSGSTSSSSRRRSSSSSSRRSSSSFGSSSSRNRRPGGGGGFGSGFGGGRSGGGGSSGGW